MVTSAFLLVAWLGAAEPERVDALQSLRERVAVEPVSPASVLAGKYTSASAELGAEVGGFLSGEDLYLFPDGTYIYCEWADIQPVTIYDKGRWKYVEGTVNLVSDRDIRWSPNAERRYLAVRRSERPTEVLLVGLERDLAHFLQNSADDPRLMLLIVGMLREQSFNAEEARDKRAQLMRTAWRPKYFKE